MKGEGKGRGNGEAQGMGELQGKRLRKAQGKREVVAVDSDVDQAVAIDQAAGAADAQDTGGSGGSGAGDSEDKKRLSELNVSRDRGVGLSRGLSAAKKASRRQSRGRKGAKYGGQQGKGTWHAAYGMPRDIWQEEEDIFRAGITLEKGESEELVSRSSNDGGDDKWLNAFADDVVGLAADAKVDRVVAVDSDVDQAAAIDTDADQAAAVGHPNVTATQVSLAPNPESSQSSAASGSDAGDGPTRIVFKAKTTKYPAAMAAATLSQGKGMMQAAKAHWGHFNSVEAEHLNRVIHNMPDTMTFGSFCSGSAMDGEVTYTHTYTHIHIHTHTHIQIHIHIHIYI